MTTTMPAWWLRKRAASRQRKETRRSAERVEWTYVPRKDEVLEDPGPYTPDPNPTSWYQFCTDRKYAYESRDEPVAAMVYWVLRAFDYEKDFDPCTDEGYKDLCDYWAYKMDGDDAREKRLTT